MAIEVLGNTSGEESAVMSEIKYPWMATVSFALSIISIPFLGLISLPALALAILFLWANRKKKNLKDKKMVVAGLIINGILLLIEVLIIALLVYMMDDIVNSTTIGL